MLVFMKPAPADRLVLVVCGFVERHHTAAREAADKVQGSEVNVAAILPRDPGQRGAKGDTWDLVDQVCNQPGFVQVCSDRREAID